MATDAGMPLSDYWLITVWQIEAPLEAVFETVCKVEQWPEWWPDARRIVQDGRNTDTPPLADVLHCTWQGSLPYTLNFDLVKTRVQPMVAVEGRVQGDLEGTGRCLFSQLGTVTTVRHEWHVRTTSGWMNLLAPLARPLFKCNHAMAMQRGGQGLARRLAAPRWHMEHRDLGRRDTTPVAPIPAIGAGVVAGLLATLVQAALWALGGDAVADLLWRDIRLTAAIVLGADVLSSETTSPPLILLSATALHLLLSAAYGLACAWLIAGQPASRALPTGGLFGVILYLVNLYGFTALFPWMEITRGPATLVAHLTFGIALAGWYLLLHRR